MSEVLALIFVVVAVVAAHSSLGNGRAARATARDVALRVVAAGFLTTSALLFYDPIRPLDGLVEALVATMAVASATCLARPLITSARVNGALSLDR